MLGFADDDGNAGVTWLGDRGGFLDLGGGPALLGAVPDWGSARLELGPLDDPVDWGIVRGLRRQRRIDAARLLKHRRKWEGAKALRRAVRDRGRACC